MDNIRVGTTILLEKDPAVKEKIMTGIEEQSKSIKELCPGLLTKHKPNRIQKNPTGYCGIL